MPTFSSLEEAYKSPNEVYKLSINVTDSKHIEEIARFKNVQMLTISGEISSIPEELKELDLYNLYIVNIKGALIIDSNICSWDDLKYFSLESKGGLKFVGLGDKTFPNLNLIGISNVSEPFNFPFNFEKIPMLKSIGIQNVSKVVFDFSDFTNNENFESMTFKGDEFIFLDDLNSPSLKFLTMINVTEKSIPNLSKCSSLEYIDFGISRVNFLPESMSKLPSLKRLIVKASIQKNDCLKALKKKGVQIEKVKLFPKYF